MSRRTAKAIVLVLLILGVVLAVEFHVASLTHYPEVGVDEPWNSAVAWTWVTTGTNSDPLTSPPRAPLPWSFGATAPLAASFALLGLGFSQARLVSLLFGIVLLLATLWVGQRSYGIAVGLLATLLLALSLPFLEASHTARPDVELAAIVMVATGLVLAAVDRERWWLHAAAGLLIGISADVHLNGAVFGIGLASVYLLAYGRHVWRQRGVWLYGGSAALAFAGLTVPRLLASRAMNVVGAWTTSLGQTHRPPIAYGNLAALLGSLKGEIGRYLISSDSLQFALIGASIAYLAVRRSKADRRLLAIVGVAFGGFVLLVDSKHPHYAIQFYAFLLLMVAETLVSLVRQGKGLAQPRVFALALLLFSLVSGAWQFLHPLALHVNYDYYAITNQIKSVVPQGARILGRPDWWLGLADHDYRASMVLTDYHRSQGYSLTQGLEAIRPDIIIMDEDLQSKLVDEGYFPPGPGLNIYTLPRGEFQEFLSQRGRKVLEFTDTWHGEFEVYAIRWD